MDDPGLTRREGLACETLEREIADDKPEVRTRDPNRSGVLSSGAVARAFGERRLEWKLQGDALTKTVRRRDFADALDYVNRIGTTSGPAPADAVRRSSEP